MIKAGDIIGKDPVSDKLLVAVAVDISDNSDTIFWDWEAGLPDANKLRAMLKEIKQGEIHYAS